jgi:hypothetical protein
MLIYWHFPVKNLDEYKDPIGQIPVCKENQLITIQDFSTYFDVLDSLITVPYGQHFSNFYKKCGIP